MVNTKIIKALELKNLNDEWIDAQHWERNWWMTNRNCHKGEIEKNEYVAKMMFLHDGCPEAKVLDIGCGPLSLLLRIPVKEGVALDPIDYGDLEESYKLKGIKRLIKRGEDLNLEDGNFDEVWIYNCLQHVENPQLILENAIKVGTKVRIFEWINIKPYKGHLHELKSTLLMEPFKNARWKTLMSTTGTLNNNGLHGDYFMGIFSKNTQN